MRLVTGLVSNYLLFNGYVTTFLTKILKPFQMSIGNYIYSEDYGKGETLFKMFDYFSFGIACVVVSCYYNLFNPVIDLVFGSEYC